VISYSLFARSPPNLTRSSIHSLLFLTLNINLI
jgi:hypothetical protein